jgi:pyruvate dehydrogenase E2 component (dihydrolipoamide acetyltransferase)
MAITITVPRLGWNMDQGVFAGWLKADGNPVRAGEALFMLESEKATENIEGFDDGILHIPANGPQVDDVVLVGAVIGFILKPGEAIPDPIAQAVSPRPSEPIGAGAPAAAANAPMPDRPDRSDRAGSSPRARRAAANLGVDWKDVKGTGRNGRIRERDVVAVAAARTAALPATPVSSTRRMIAHRMSTSHRSTAPVTLMRTVDATEMVKLRDRWKAQAESGGGFVPTYTELFVKLTAMALEKHPVLNARWENDRIVLQQGIHIGIAVDTDAGLVVPVIHDVPSLSLKEVSMRSRDLIERARKRRLSANDFQGGTFSVTSLGALGVDAFTPIINYPECAILGLGRIRRCPAVLDDQIVIRDQMTLSLTFDHRITDGAPAARFLQTLSALVENPNFI